MYKVNSLLMSIDAVHMKFSQLFMAFYLMGIQSIKEMWQGTFFVHVVKFYDTRLRYSHNYLICLKKASSVMEGR